MAEVSNGGHNQFFCNSTGIVWEDALKGFEVVGLSEVQKILRASVERMGGKPSKDQAIRIQFLKDEKPDFNDFDDEYYEVESKGGIYPVLAEYIKKNRKYFYYGT